MNNQNLLLDIKDVTTESMLPIEPVSLQEMKDFLRLEGFGDPESGSMTSDFDFDDLLIESMITAARKKAEAFCGISIVFHSWKVLLTNRGGDSDLPYGPIQSVTSIVDKNGNDVTTYKLRGFNFQFLESPKQELLTLEYDAGYDDVPEEIVLAIKQMVWYWYNVRGTIDASTFGVNVQLTTIPDIALSTLRPFKRSWTWLA